PAAAARAAGPRRAPRRPLREPRGAAPRARAAPRGRLVRARGDRALPLRRPRRDPRMGLLARGGRPGLAASAFAAAAAAALPCARARGEAVHVGRPGENAYRISLYYGVPVDRVARANHLATAGALEVGESLRIPGARRAPPEAPLLPPPAPAPSEAALDAFDSGLAFTWPVRGAVSSRFGTRGWGHHHEGIDIPAPEGTRILAAEAGRVIHGEGLIGDYGNVVIVKHAGRYATVYAHTCRNLVRDGEFVAKGQPIAQVGESGHASGPHLHFEIRRDRLPQDPLRFLP